MCLTAVDRVVRVVGLRDGFIVLQVVEGAIGSAACASKAVPDATVGTVDELLLGE